MTKLSREVGEAALALETNLPPVYVRPTKSNALIEIAKKLQRLQTKAARLRRDLRVTLHDIRTAKRELKALAQSIGRGE